MSNHLDEAAGMDRQPHCVQRAFEQSQDFEITQEQAELLENIHFRKIDISDEIFVINVDGYIGNTTRKEIEYAKKKGKAD